MQLWQVSRLREVLADDDGGPGWSPARPGAY